MITTADAAIVEVGMLNKLGCGARPSYAEFIYACEEAVAGRRMVEVRPHPAARREFWVPDLAPATHQQSRRK